jgi:hypothetical protein
MLLATAATSRAQLIYSNNFNVDDSANWAVNYSTSQGAANTLVDFNFDYTTVGIPIAPHSTELGSTGVHHGLKISPDIIVGTLTGAAGVPGASASPTNFSITANFDMHAQMWINYQGPNTANIVGGNATNAFTSLQTGGGGSGSTLLYGCGYGTLGTNAVVAGEVDCIFCASTTDTGSSAQMRMYGPSAVGVASYQSFAYQNSGTLVPAFPGDPYVYNNPTGTRSFYTTAAWAGVPAPNWTNFFPSVKPPQAQITLWAQQTNIQCNIGALAFAWHDVEVQKIGNVIVYSIDGHLAATGNEVSAGTNAGSYLVFVGEDINSTVSTDPNYTNLNFVVFANVVVSNYNNIVNVSASTATTSEAPASPPGVITITRTSVGVPLTVNYTLTGTATNGVQYSVGPGATTTSVTFAANATSTNISIVPIDDGVPQPTTTVILTLQSGNGYAGAGSAIVSILDNDPTTVDITSSSQAYGRYNTGVYYDFIAYNVTRRGKLSTGSDLTVNLSYSGSAVSGQDYTQISSITIPDGSATSTALNANGVPGLQVRPLDNPLATDNRTVVVSLAPGTGYAIGTGSATGTVVSAHYPAAPAVLLSDDLTGSTAPETNNWKTTYGCGNPQDDSTNYQVNFGMLLSSAGGGFSIAPPPGGNLNALHLTCNKDVTPGAPGALNVYYTNLWLNGDYAVRFNMNLIQCQSNASATEGAVFGINHSGSLSNWWYGGGFITNQNWSSDGVWYYVTAQPAGQVQGDYQIFTGQGGTNGNAGFVRPLAAKSQTDFAQVFKDTPGPFTCVDGFSTQTPGVPAEGSPALFYDNSSWSDVEIRQQGNIITMSINRKPIFVYTNNTVWKSGYLMLGYTDPFGATIASQEAGVYYANLQVVSLQATPIWINSIAINGGNVEITFSTQTASDTAGSFTLMSSGTLTAPFSATPGTSIVSVGIDQFRATTPYHGGTQLYRILHN